MKFGNNSVIGLRLARSKLKDPQTIVVGAPPPPQRATLPLALAPISRKLHLGRVRGLSRKTIEVPLASKKQSPPVRGSGYVHRSKDVCYRIQLSLLFWTNRQKIRTPEQFSSTPKELYSTVPNATHS